MIRTAIAALALGCCTGAVGSGTPHITPANDPGCFDDEVATVAPDNGIAPDVDWVCVTLDEFADQASLDRLEQLLAELDDVCAIQPDGSIHRWNDPVGVVGTIAPCPTEGP